LIGNLLENIKYFIKIFAIVILSVLVFDFIHSELDLIKCEQDTHSEHDYCVLVEAASPEIIGQRNFDSIKNIISVLNGLFPYVDNLFLHDIFPAKTDFTTYISPKNIYILHNSLLI
jgi:hypothetical protein